MIGRKFRTRNGRVVTLKGVSGGNFSAITAEGKPCYVTNEDLCHIIGEEDKCGPHCWDNAEKLASKDPNSPSESE